MLADTHGSSFDFAQIEGVHNTTQERTLFMLHVRSANHWNVQKFKRNLNQKLQCKPKKSRMNKWREAQSVPLINWRANSVVHSVMCVCASVVIWYSHCVPWYTDREIVYTTCLCALTRSLTLLLARSFACLPANAYAFAFVFINRFPLHLYLCISENICRLTSHVTFICIHIYTVCAVFTCACVCVRLYIMEPEWKSRSAPNQNRNPNEERKSRRRKNDSSNWTLPR